MSHDSNHEPVSISIDTDIIDAVDRYCRQTMRKRSDVFQEAALEFLAKEKARRFPKDFLNIINSMDGAPS